MKTQFWKNSRISNLAQISTKLLIKRQGQSWGNQKAKLLLPHLLQKILLKNKWNKQKTSTNPPPQAGGRYSYIKPQNSQKKLQSARRRWSWSTCSWNSRTKFYFQFVTIPVPSRSICNLRYPRKNISHKLKTHDLCVFRHRKEVAFLMLKTCDFCKFNQVMPPPCTWWDWLLYKCSEVLLKFHSGVYR